MAFKPDSAAPDNQGSWWLTWRHGLYRYRDGLCVPILKADDPQPFIDGRRLDEAFVDARGNAFLRDGSNRDESVILAPPAPPPRTTLSEPAAAGGDASEAPRDRQVVRLATDAGAVDGKVRFEWRLDGKAWTALAADGPTATVTLDALPAGAHRLEARSFDAALQTDPVPAALSFEVQVDPRAQIAADIARLADPDFSRREAAVAALALQPERALPALRAARATATDDDQRWWIDAALQRIDTVQHASTP